MPLNDSHYIFDKLLGDGVLAGSEQGFVKIRLVLHFSCVDMPDFWSIAAAYKYKVAGP